MLVLMRKSILIALAGAVIVWGAQVALTGKVTFANDSPAIGAPIRVMMSTGALYAVADQMGNYSFSVAEGLCHSVEVYTMGQEVAGLPKFFTYTAYQNFTISGNTVKDVKLPPFVRISGVLTSPAGNPVAGAQVQSKRIQENMTVEPIDESTTDSKGEFELFCYVGKVLIIAPQIPDSGFASFSDTLTVSRDTSLIVSYPVSPVISGTVLGHNGDTIRHIKVTLNQNDQYYWTRSNDMGRYFFTISPGRVDKLGVEALNDTLRAVPKNFSFTAYTDFEVISHTEKDIVLPNFPVFSGYIKDPEGNPISGAVLQCFQWNGTMTYGTSDEDTTTDAGEFRLVCSEGDNQIRIVPPPLANFSGSVIYIHITADSSATITLSRGTIVAGKVTFADSVTPVVGIEVALSNGYSRERKTTNNEGKFHFLVEPGYYQSLEAFTMASEVAGVPSYINCFAFAESTLIEDSTWWHIVLPPLHRVSGRILNGALEPVADVRISAQAWVDGRRGFPRDEYVTMSDGAYELFVSTGQSAVEVRPGATTAYAICSFMLNVDTSMSKDIVLADQLKGIARIQPSVISQGKKGLITLTGVNTNFTNGIDSIILGEGIVVSDIQVRSPISLTASISIGSATPSGVRSVRVVTPSGTLIGAELLTITEPSSARLDFDAEGKLLRDIIIDDGTGTRLVVDSGTHVILPRGADSVLSFDAPIIKNNAVHPADAEFLQVQREFYPSGVSFDPPARLAFRYQDQDVEGVDETGIRAFKYDNRTDSVIGEYTIVKRDTANNVLVHEVTTFSLFRLASSLTPTRLDRIQEAKNQKMETALKTMTTSQNNVLVIYTVPRGKMSLPVEIEIFDVKGRKIAEIAKLHQPSGQYRICWIARSSKGHYLSRGMYWITLRVGDAERAKKFIVLQ